MRLGETSLSTMRAQSTVARNDARSRAERCSAKDFRQTSLKNLEDGSTNIKLHISTNFASSKARGLRYSSARRRGMRGGPHRRLLRRGFGPSQNGPFARSCLVLVSVWRKKRTRLRFVTRRPSAGTEACRRCLSRHSATVINRKYCPMLQLDDAIISKLHRPTFWHFVTLASDGMPHVRPVWVDEAAVPHQKSSTSPRSVMSCS